MPSTFVQTASQDPSFLKDYMYSYASGVYNGNETMLQFNPLPALFTFVVTNSTGDPVQLQEISLSMIDAPASHGKSIRKSASLPFFGDNVMADQTPYVAAGYSDVAFDWASGNVDLSYDSKGYEKVSVTFENGTSLAVGGDYTAYFTALPLSSDTAFQGKYLLFSVKVDGQSQTVIQMDAASLAELNDADIYNWVGGKSYVININLGVDGLVRGEIVAENNINVATNIFGNYTLKYEGSDGQPLSNYYSICTLTVDELASYEDFIDVNVAPREAACIGIYDSSNRRKGGIELDQLRPDYSETPMYTFGLLSDVHMGRSSSSSAESDFQKALKFFNEEGVKMICVCGDITQGGTEEQLASYASIASQSATPVYTTTGNHDCTGDTGVNPELWKQYTGEDVVFEKSVTVNGKTDHFIFFGMSYYDFDDAYLDEHFEWLEERLEAYRNERCFVFTHLFFPDRAGNLNDIYPSGNWLKGPQLVRLKKICDNYVNTLWFSGHSHWEWTLQKYQDRANIYRQYTGSQPASGWCVHVPSCADPITSNGSSRVNVPANSEGAIVKVYDNFVEILGLNMLTGKYFPIATYRLDTSLQDVPATENVVTTHYISANDFVENASKAGATVVDVDGMPNYVEVTFTAKKQGFYVLNSTYSSAATSVSIIVEDVQAFSDGVQVDVPENVGFYGSNYYLTTTNSANVYHYDDYQGVQFQTSSSKYEGPLPLTIRMKAQMVFY